MRICKTTGLKCIRCNPGACDHAADDGMDKYIKHTLKILPEYFEAVVSGKKTFEIRKNDRDYARGDLFMLQEWNPETGYTGRTFIQSIGYILKDCPEYGLINGYCVFCW